MTDVSQTGDIGPEAWEAAFLRAYQYMQEVSNVVTITKFGFHRVRGFSELLGLLVKEQPDPDFSEEDLAEQKELAQLAAREMEKDFPMVNGQALIVLWSGVESYIEDLAVAWMESNPAVLSGPIIARVRIPVAAFQALDREEQLHFIVSELERDLKVDLKSGATKLESLLKILGLDGSVDRRVREALFEAQHLRNILAHRSGIADRKFVAACPALGFSVGEPVMIDNALFRRLANGLRIYVLTVNNRCRAHNGLEPLIHEPDGFDGALTNPAGTDG